MTVYVPGTCHRCYKLGITWADSEGVQCLHYALQEIGAGFPVERNPVRDSHLIGDIESFLVDHEYLDKYDTDTLFEMAGVIKIQGSANWLRRRVTASDESGQKNEAVSIANILANAHNPLIGIRNVIAEVSLLGGRTYPEYYTMVSETSSNLREQILDHFVPTNHPQAVGYSVLLSWDGYAYERRNLEAQNRRRAILAPWLSGGDFYQSLAIAVEHDRRAEVQETAMCALVSSAPAGADIVQGLDDLNVSEIASAETYEIISEFTSDDFKGMTTSTADWCITQIASEYHDYLDEEDLDGVPEPISLGLSAAYGVTYATQQEIIFRALYSEPTLKTSDLVSSLR